MKILEICPFSAGGCGVWARAKQESLELAKRGHEIMVFSSNATKGCDDTAPTNENIGEIRIMRFPYKKLGGESFMRFSFEKEAINYEPDVIIAHNYRHLHTTKAIKVAEKLRKSGKKCKVFLVTHAPFVEGNITRSFIAKKIVGFYDKFIGPITLNKFDKVIVISNWEIPYLIKCGLKRSKIEYIPNGIPEEFFTQKKEKEENKVLFLGRVSIKKKIETLVEAIPYIKDKKLKIEIVGPEEKEYADKIKNLINSLKLGERVLFSGALYDLKKKIAKYDSAKIFVLPSRVEGMPQSLIEAMARGKIVIGSDSIAIRDLIKDGKNGYLFEFDNPKSLADKINMALKKDSDKLSKEAKKFAEQFSFDKIIFKLEKLFMEK